MAKKKATSTPAESPDSRAIVVSMKGTVEFRDWLNRLAEFDRSTAVQVMEKGAVAYAKQIGFAEAAPKRTGGRWYVFHVKGDTTLYASNERPEDIRGLVFLEEGTRLQDNIDASVSPKGYARPEVVLCRSKVDPKLFRRYSKDSIPPDFAVSEFTFGAHYNKQQWEEHARHIPALQKIRKETS